jgi:hypothetical protein
MSCVSDHTTSTVMNTFKAAVTKYYTTVDVLNRVLGIGYVNGRRMIDDHAIAIRC